MDRAIHETAKAAITRQMAELENQRTGLKSALDSLREQSNDNSDELIRLTRETLEMAKLGLEKVATPSEFNNFIDRFVGKMTILPNGIVEQKKLPTTEVAGSDSMLVVPKSHITRPVAGAALYLQM